MGKKKSRMMIENQCKVRGSEDEKEEGFIHDEDLDDLDVENSDDEEEGYEDNSEDQDEKEGSEEDSQEDLHDALDLQRGEEMEELEKEYKELRSEEQDLLRNLRQHKDEDFQKGQAVKNQRALWDKTLEFRFLLQKSFAISNRLPQEPVRSLFCDTDSNVTEAYLDLIASSKKTLDSILELQQALIANNPAITQSEEGKSKQLEASSKSDGDLDEEWLQIARMQSRMASYRNKSIDKWHRKTQVTTGVAAMKDKLHAFNQSISNQVAAYVRDPSKMIKGMQQNRSVVAVFGNAPDSIDNISQEGIGNGDPELLDDSEFYQQLLKEFFKTIDPSSSEMAFYAMKWLQTKKRKIVERRASKSRKIWYNVHEKIVNFMAPQLMNLPPTAPKLFENLFGLKTQKSASGA